MTIENNPPLGIYPPNIVNEPEPEPEHEPIENNPPLGIYPPNIVNDWPPSIATDDSITVVVNNYYDKQIIKIHLGANVQTIYALNIGWGQEFYSTTELVNPGINTQFYLNNATNNIDFDNFYNIYNIENYTSFIKVTPEYTSNFLRLLVNGTLSFSNNNYLELEFNQQYNFINPVTVFINQSFDWDIAKLIIDGNNIIVPIQTITEWREQQPTVNYIYNFNFPQNIMISPSPNIPIVIYIENYGKWSQRFLEDGRYQYTIRFSVFYYQNDDWRDNVNNLINDDVFNLSIFVTSANIVSDNENNINSTLFSASYGNIFPHISNRQNVNGDIRTFQIITNSSTHPLPVNYFTANINYPQYIINIQTILYDNIANLSNFAPMGFLMGNPINTSAINIILLPEITTDLLDNLRHIKINEKYYKVTSSSNNYEFFTVNIDKTITEDIDSRSEIYGNPINISPTPEFYNFQLLGVISSAVSGTILTIYVDLIKSNSNIESLFENLLFIRLDNKDTGNLLTTTGPLDNATINYNEETNIVKINIQEYTGNIDRGTLVYASRLNYTDIPLSINDIHNFKPIGRLLYKTPSDPNVNNNLIEISLFYNVDLNTSLANFYFIKIGNSETIFNVAGFNVDSEENFTDMFRINLYNGITELHEVGTIVYGSLIETVNISFTEYKLIGKIDNPITDIPTNEIFIELIPEINIQKSFDNFNFIIIENDLYTVQYYNLVNRNNSNILGIITLETINNNYDLNASVYGYNILYIEPIIPDINPDINPENNIDNNPYQLTLTTCCPPKVHHGNGIRRSWTAGTFLIDGSHLNKARLCASRINNTIYGPIHGKPVFVKNNLNVYGRYTGFPGGSGAPIRNKF